VLCVSTTTPGRTYARSPHAPATLASMTDLHLIHGSSESATKIAPDFVGKVALVATSPPYHNAISYASHQIDPTANYRDRENIGYADEYLPMLGRVWHECFKMLRPGGYIAINVGTVLDAGYHYPLPQDIMSQILSTDDEWDFVRTIYWNKITAGVKRAGSVIQHALPGYWYPNIMTEHIMVFQRHGEHSILNNDVPREWWDNIWDLAPVPPGMVEHPAPFPEDLPHRFIRMLTSPGDVVMDPFNGAGATTKAALDLGRTGLGFDISSAYITTARRRAAADSSVRSKQLLVHPVRASAFSPGKSKGRTRHGAGLSARRRRS